ncbi:MAG: hypothetical protein J6O61_13285 [Butyrivibrio sp.]|uniref:DUF5688 family protein n=1 Tax=Butyrivibrio sp. TaxID=28121 RepID=UPI001B067C3A|nr:DUF5688 family protein [Butyrivibrio sp.]MBO6241793.1 hypothetical protein [Butyrivibrio sp.]
MNILEFGKIMSEEVSDVLGEKVNVEYREVTKNNGIVNHALIIKKKEENVAPTIYIDHLYDQYKDGKVLMSIVNEIVDIYKQNAPGKGVDMTFFEDFSKVAALLSFKVINYYKNQKYLEDIPCKRFADLALVPVCLIHNEKLGDGSITIKSDHLKVWEVSENELWENVFENAPKISPYSFSNISEYLVKQSDAMLMNPFPDMFVLTNSAKHNGAGVFLYPKVIETISKKLESSIVIIPSSVHEVIVLPYDRVKIEAGAIYQMVKEVNSSVVEEGEILSDNVYYYDKETDKIGILQEEIAI